jgi:hypothetical protein
VTGVGVFGNAGAAGGAGGAVDVNRLGLRSPDAMRVSGVVGGTDEADAVTAGTDSISGVGIAMPARGEVGAGAWGVFTTFLLYPPGRGFIPKRNKLEEKLTSKRRE